MYNRRTKIITYYDLWFHTHNLILRKASKHWIGALFSFKKSYKNLYILQLDIVECSYAMVSHNEIDLTLLLCSADLIC